MKISELNSGQGNVNVSGTIKEIDEPRTFNKFGRDLVVVNALLEDDSGSIKLTLWNDDAKRFKENDQIEIENGYVNEFQGEKQLTSGKFGSIKKLTEESKEKTENQKDSEESENTESEDNSLQDEIKEEVF